MFPKRLVHTLLSNEMNLSDISIETLNIPNHNVSFIYFTTLTNPRNLKWTQPKWMEAAGKNGSYFQPWPSSTSTWSIGFSTKIFPSFPIVSTLVGWTYCSVFFLCVGLAAADVPKRALKSLPIVNRKVLLRFRKPIDCLIFGYLFNKLFLFCCRGGCFGDSYWSKTTITSSAARFHRPRNLLHLKVFGCKVLNRRTSYKLKFIKNYKKKRKKRFFLKRFLFLYIFFACFLISEEK